MGVSVGGKIVTDGLLVHLDAANKRSYPGSGDAWLNLAPYPDRSGSFADGVPPVVANGYASFTGVDSPQSPRVLVGANFGSQILEISELTEYVTVDMWLKLKTALTADDDAKYICGWNTAYAVQVNGDALGYTGAAQTNEIYGIGNASELGLFNNWKHYCFVMLDSRNGPTISDHKIYINGQSQVLSAQNGTVTQAYFKLNPFTSCLFGFPSRNFTGGASATLNSDIAIVKVYTRQLSQAEVLQNFNAHKGRFNIY
jgi:hypothetical protein